jgi:hypothetical protein
MNYACPVCLYPKMEEPPEKHAICPCCGTQFGYDDCTKTLIQLRWDWIRDGARWFDEATTPPANWDPYKQVGIRAETASTRITQKVVVGSARTIFATPQLSYRVA